MVQKGVKSNTTQIPVPWYKFFRAEEHIHVYLHTFLDIWRETKFDPIAIRLCMQKNRKGCVVSFKFHKSIDDKLTNPHCQRPQQQRHNLVPHTGSEKETLRSPSATLNDALSTLSSKNLYVTMKTVAKEIVKGTIH